MKNDVENIDGFTFLWYGDEKTHFSHSRFLKVQRFLNHFRKPGLKIVFKMNYLNDIFCQDHLRLVVHT